MTTIYITKQFTAGPLRGLRFDTAMPGFLSDAEAAKWVRIHRTRPVKTHDGARYIVVDASFQNFIR